MKQECPRLLAFAVQYYVYLFFNPLALYRVFGEDEQELIELNASKLIMRREFVAGERVCQGQKDCRYDEAHLREPGQGLENVLWHQPAKAQR